MNKEKFDNFAENKSIDTLTNIFKVSTSTVKKWKSIDGSVPDYAIEIINLRFNNTNLIKTIDSLNFDIMSYKQTVINYLHSKQKVESLING